MKNLPGLIKLFFKNSGLCFSRGMQYRADFIVGIVTTFFLSAITPLIQLLIFTNTRGFPGWTLNEIVLFQGLLLLWLGIRDLCFSNIYRTLLQLIWHGEFDRLLLKPYPSIGILLTSGFNEKSIGTIVSGMIVTAYAIARLGLAVSLAQVALVIVSIAFGLLFSMACFVVMCGWVILLVKNGRMGEVFETLFKFGDYPLELFPRRMQVLFVIFIPCAVWVNIPVNVLLHRLDTMMLLAFPSCVIFFYISLSFWKICLKKYSSAGG